MITDISFPAFVNEAACAGLDPELFFPGAGESPEPAKAVCESCDVRKACLAYCLKFETEHPGSRWGIYAGTTPEQRRDRTPTRCCVPVPRTGGRSGPCRKVIAVDGLCRDHLDEVAS